MLRYVVVLGALVALAYGQSGSECTEDSQCQSSEWCEMDLPVYRKIMPLIGDAVNMGNQGNQDNNGKRCEGNQGQGNGNQCDPTTSDAEVTAMTGTCQLKLENWERCPDDNTCQSGLCMSVPGRMGGMYGPMLGLDGGRGGGGWAEPEDGEVNIDGWEEEDMEMDDDGTGRRRRRPLIPKPLRKMVGKVKGNLKNGMDTVKNAVGNLFGGLGRSIRMTPLKQVRPRRGPKMGVCVQCEEDAGCGQGEYCQTPVIDVGCMKRAMGMKALMGLMGGHHGGYRGGMGMGGGNFMSVNMEGSGRPRNRPVANLLSKVANGVSRGLFKLRPFVQKAKKAVRKGIEEFMSRKKRSPAMLQKWAIGERPTFTCVAAKAVGQSCQRSGECASGKCSVELKCIN